MSLDTKTLKDEAQRLIDIQTANTRMGALYRHEYLKVATPEAVLALIAENERIKARLCVCRDCGGQGEVYSGHSSYQGHNQPPEPDMDVCGTCGGDGVLGPLEDFEALADERDQLKAENERLKAGVDSDMAEIDRIQTEYDKQFRKARGLRIERDQLSAEVAEWKDTVKFNEKCWSEERGTMIDKLQESRMRIKEMDLLFGRYILAMRSALIEEEHGKGPAAAMEWIYNSLAGPGELPPEGETDSQAYFDREIVAVDDGMQQVIAFHDGRRATMGKGEQS